MRKYVHVVSNFTKPSVVGAVRWSNCFWIEADLAARVLIADNVVEADGHGVVDSLVG